MNSLIPREYAQYASLPHWRREERRTPSPGLLIAGAVVVGLGVLGWVYLGPDFKRYMKIRSM